MVDGADPLMANGSDPASTNGEDPDAVMAAQILEYERLIGLARDRTASGRSLLVGAMADLLGGAATARLSDRQRALAGEILLGLVRAIERDVRAALAERLAHAPSVPRELILFLAQDDIPVARPLLANSPVLTDEDLVTIVRSRGTEHRTVIAGRPRIGGIVCAALIESRDLKALRALVANDEIVLDRTHLTELTDLSLDVEDLREPLLRRGDMQGDLAVRLYLYVSAELRAYLQRRFDVREETLDAALDGALEDLLERGGGGDEPTPPMVAWAERSARAGKLTPRLMIRVLRAGRLPLFVALLARACGGLPVGRVGEIVRESGGERLASLCRLTGATKPEFASLFLLSRAARRGEQVVDPRELSRVLAHFEALRPHQARARLDQWLAEWGPPGGAA